MGNMEAMGVFTLIMSLGLAIILMVPGAICVMATALELGHRRERIQ